MIRENLWFEIASEHLFNHLYSNFILKSVIVKLNIYLHNHVERNSQFLIENNLREEGYTLRIALVSKWMTVRQKMFVKTRLE